MDAMFAWRIEPLPDFLADHTLPPTAPPERLREHASRWVQFVACLWGWSQKAGFALRYVSRSGATSVYFVAVSRDTAAGERLQGDVETLLRAHRLATSPKDLRVLPDEFQRVSALPRMAIVEVTQHVTEELWELPEVMCIDWASREGSAWMSNPPRHPLVVFPWWGPGGPFLLPLESMLSQRAAVSLTIYLEPTELRRAERLYLSTMAREAKSRAEQNLQQLGSGASMRAVDPSAELAGRLYTANLRRLTATPFLCRAHCAAENGQIDAALSLAGAIGALVHEVAFDRPQQEDNRLPSGISTRVVEAIGGSSDSVGRRPIQFDQILFESTPEEDPVSRLPCLVDAQGAATVFRLPVSVRGGVPGARVRQLPPDFNPGARDETVKPGELVLGRFHHGGLAKMPMAQLTKHALVTGFTGSGKTVTVLNLIHQVRAAGTPVLAIESAKQEYRGLLGVPQFCRGDNPLRVYTVGNETCAPIRLNPFELLPGVRVESHINRLQVCFEAALPPIGPLSSMVGEALVEVYERRGWRLTDVAPAVGEPMFSSFPTMTDFVERMSQVVDERGYEGEVRSNVMAAVLGRLKPLTIGSKGFIFREASAHRVGTRRAHSSIDDLLSQSVVLELNDLNVEDKALFVMFVLMFLREYRELHPAPHGSLAHVTVVEEAHNVLENVQSVGNTEGGGSDTRHKAVQAFSSMLSEIRALGEGLIIVDQSPEKLAPDAIRNTNLQIGHQLRDARDREAMARAMIMDDEQRDFLGKLEPGHAALFITGLQKATFVQAPLYCPSPADLQLGVNETCTKETSGSLRFPGIGYRVFSDLEVAERMAPHVSEYRTGPFDEACRPCSARLNCSYRAGIQAALVGAIESDRFSTIVGHYAESPDADRERTVRQLVGLAHDVAQRRSEQVERDAVWCAFVHLWHSQTRSVGRPFPADSRGEFLQILSEQDVLGDGAPQASMAAPRGGTSGGLDTELEDGHPVRPLA